MKAEVLKAAIGELHVEVQMARDARHQIELEEDLGQNQRGGWEEPREALAYYLDRVYEMLTVVLEAAEMTDTRMRLMEKWKEFEKARLTTTTYNPNGEFTESPALSYLETLLRGLSVSSGQGISPRDAIELGHLETLLRRTAVLVRDRNENPRSEADVQHVMHDYLSAFFTEYKHPVHVPGIIKNFEPDGGIRDLRAAIEFKFATNKLEVATALGGIFEDIPGYSGSLDWTRFYSVVYQTEAFETEDRFRAEIARAGAVVWTPIVVTGGGDRKKK